MISDKRRPGRPSRTDPPVTRTPLEAAVLEALAARRDGMLAGPRSLADLARVLDCSPQQLTHALAGRRPTPTVAQIRTALPEIEPYPGRT